MSLFSTGHSAAVPDDHQHWNLCHNFVAIAPRQHGHAHGPNDHAHGPIKKNIPFFFTFFNNFLSNGVAKKTFFLFLPKRGSFYWVIKIVPL